VTISTEFHPWLSERQARVERILTERLMALEAHTPARLLEAMRYSLLDGGKRMRPVLCIAFAEAVAPASEGVDADDARARIEDAAAALEAIHTYSLIHDDLPAMDDDDLRRGRPTSHRMFGEALAILAGDALLTEAFAWLGREGTAVRGRMCGELAQAAGAAGMVGGQVYDISESREGTLAYLERLHRMKTGALIRASCRLGVLAAGGGAAALEAATRYGEAVGLAFQMADDVLDVTADAATLGKPTGADAAAGRDTFPAVVGLEETRRMAAEQVAIATRAIHALEPTEGPLAAIARWAVERAT